MQPYESVKEYETIFKGFKEGSFFCGKNEYGERVLQVDIHRKSKTDIYMSIGGIGATRFRVTKDTAKVLGEFFSEISKFLE